MKVGEVLGGSCVIILLACGARSTLETDGTETSTGAGGVGGQPTLVGGFGGAGGGFGGLGGEGGVVEPACPAPDATFCTSPKPCYLGLAALAGQGLCVLGERACAAGGVGQSECTGAVLPRPDSCVAPTTWTCDAAPHPCHPSLGVSAEWTRRISVVAQDSFYATVDGALQLRAAGAVVWSFPLGWTDRALTHDASGVLVAGELGDSAFITKVSPAGAELWTREFPGELLEFGDGMSSAADGGFFLPGSSEAEEVVDGVAFPLGPYVAKFSESGSLEWVHSVHGELASVRVVRERADGSVVVGGASEGPCGGQPPAIVAFDPAGMPLWSWSARNAGHVDGGPGAQPFTATGDVSQVVVHPQGRVFAVGRLDIEGVEAVDLGDGLPRVGRSFIVALEADGIYRWAHDALDVAMSEAPEGRLAQSATGNLVWASHSASDSVLRTFDPDGTLLWERPIHVLPVDTPMTLWDLDPLPDGDLLLLGEVPSPAEFHPSGTFQGGRFLARFGP